MKIFSMLDKKMGEYGALVLANNDEVVIRGLSEHLVGERGNSTLVKHPEDFDLMCVGQFDVETGRIVAWDPKFVCNVSSLRKEV